MIINVVTSNTDKYNEIKHILNKSNIKTKQIKNIEIPEIQGNSIDIIKAKLDFVTKIIPGIILVEDTSFQIEGMNGLPGPYIKDFFLKLGNKKFYQLAKTFGKRAKETCYIGIRLDENKIFTGEIDGDILEPDNDPWDEYNWAFFFKPDESELTYGKISLEDKCKVSARRRAIIKLCNYLINYYLISLL